ncbi:hypothetical protein JCM21900_000010 [Sporobolomyces salmonicolor]
MVAEGAPEPWIRQDTLVVPVSGFAFGFTSGMVTSSKLASKQFLAENAHRLPTTVQGWYFYKKTKNYRVLFAGLKGGFRTGSRLGLWTGAFVALQEGIQAGIAQALGSHLGERPTRWAAGAVAGVTLASAAGAWYRLSRYTAPRRLLLGLTMGAAAGGAVDARDWMRRRIALEEKASTENTRTGPAVDYAQSTLVGSSTAANMERHPL